MANNLLVKINEAEKVLDEKILQAKQEAAKIVSDAETKAEEILFDSDKKATAAAQDIINDANKKAEAFIAAEKLKSDEKTAEIKKAAQSHESAAVLAVTKKLLELA
ncbi:MAG: hypothetical protein IKL47_07730 [Clostridia bacterium]|nr:hypothetical protein [Clostridia bacterium]